MNAEREVVVELARGRREATSWTVPLRRASAAFMVVYALAQLLTNTVLVTESALERTLRASNSLLTPDEVHATATLDYTVSLVLVVIITAALAVLAMGSLRGWRWAFWVDLVALALVSVTVLTNALALASPAVQALPPAAIMVNLVIAVVALGLLVWFIAAAARYGPWAMRRTGS